MKRVLFTIALCVITSVSFAQKNAVKDAENLAKKDKNYTEARNTIKGALENAETKDDAKTWYIAGYVEDQQFTNERTKEILGQQPNEPVMYQALMSILPFFEKAHELDQKPDAKGKVKPAHTRNIKNMLSANHVYYINGGAYYFDERDYKKAYDSFNQYLHIADMPMFQGERIAERDSNYMMVQFFAAVSATQVENPTLAIEALSRAKAFDYRRNDVYQYLCAEYQSINDTISLERTLEEGMSIFPEEKYYLLSLINTYIFSNRNDKALQFLNTAISKEPNDAQLYDVMGRVYEAGLQDYANAEKYFLQALSLDSENADILSNLGRVYYNQGVTKQGEANDLNDNKLYLEALEKAKDLFRKAMPHFEKAHKMKPDEREFIVALRGIYYNLDMGKEFEEMDAKM